jgi:hypothetical protein
VIDIESIEDADDCDGESLRAYGYDRELGEWQWQWVPVEVLLEAGRGDLVPWLVG